LPVENSAKPVDKKLKKNNNFFWLFVFLLLIIFFAKKQAKVIKSFQRFINSFQQGYEQAENAKKRHFTEKISEKMALF